MPEDGLQVKLVGSTISCEGAHEFGGSSGRGRHNPHVQSYVVATDQVGKYQFWPCCHLARKPLPEAFVP